MNIRSLAVHSDASAYLTRIPTVSSVDVKTIKVALKTFGNLMIPRGVVGFIANYIGWLLGTLYITPVAGVVSSRLMTTAMATACRVYGVSTVRAFVAKCGALYMAEKAVTPLVIFFAGMASGYAFVFLTNAAGLVIYKVCLEGDTRPVAVQMDKLPPEVSEAYLVSKE